MYTAKKGDFMTKKIGINGFGRIGRMIFRAWLERDSQDIEIVAVNNPLGKDQTISHFVHMLEYDSVHGKLKGTFEVKDDGFSCNGKFIKFFSERDPGQIKWSDVGTNLVVDSTGIFKDKSSLGKHLSGTVTKVIMSAPGDDLDGTFVVGVNDHLYDATKHHIVSNASCTTNCLAPIVKILHENFEIINGVMNTCHSYTADQRLVDGDHSDLRRARAAAMSIIPSKTGAAKAIGEVIPELKGKLDGFALRVPTPNVSVVDLTINVKKETTKDQVNGVLKLAAQSNLSGILAVSDKELVSVDFNGNEHSSIVDSKYTMVMDKTLIKVLSWYDNEWGYSNRVLDLAKKM